MHEEILELMERADEISKAVTKNIFEVYEFILESEGLALIA